MNEWATFLSSLGPFLPKFSLPFYLILGVKEKQKPLKIALHFVKNFMPELPPKPKYEYSKSGLYHLTNVVTFQKSERGKPTVQVQ